jgi:hypothetical protein
LQLTEAPAEKEAPPAPDVAPQAASRRISPLYLAILAVAILALCAIGYFSMSTPTPLDRFWGPVLKQSSNISVCIPVAASAAQTNTSPAPVQSPLGIPFVGLTDNTALVEVVRFLDSKNSRFNVKLLSFSFSDVTNPSAAPLLPTLAELRNGPIIFIGNSDWSMRLVAPLRYHIVGDYGSDTYWVGDRQNPSAKNWIEKIDQPYKDYAQDYAIISRFFDQTTGQTVIAVNGLGLHATAAAAEFITDPAYMSQVAAGDSRDWQKNNVQIVISTKIAGESWGPPRILAKYFW